MDIAPPEPSTILSPSSTASSASLPRSRPALCSTDEITLNVSGTRFPTTIGTLVDRSDFFAVLFSGRWPIPAQPDGAIFVDSNPSVFCHVLSYLRRGVFPLAFDARTGGHDVALYIALLPEARYFQVPMLQRWLEDELYLRCVDHASTWRRLSDAGLGTETWTSVPGVQLVKRSTRVEHTWVCSSSLKEDSHRLIYGHGLCGEPEHGVVNRAERTEWMEYGTRTTFHRGWCSDEG